MDQKRVLNVGGNSKKIPIPVYFDGWDHLLLDIDPTGKPDICCDARTMGELEGDQFDAIYCSHNLEHFYAHDVPKVLAGFRHVLRSDGFAEIRVPDLGAVMKSVVDRGMDIEDALYMAPAGPISVRDVLYGFGRKIEQSGQDFYAHRTGFTKKSLQAALFKEKFPSVIVGSGSEFEIIAIAFKSQPTAQQLRQFGVEAA